jgi:hypothetical protein
MPKMVWLKYKDQVRPLKSITDMDKMLKSNGKYAESNEQDENACRFKA